MNDTNENDAINIVGAGLQRLAEEQIGIRQVIEDRWLRDLEQFLGEDDAQTKARLQKSGKSGAFVNGTRPKTTAVEARLSDMLFPTDDKNWGISPTPVPDISNIKNSKKLLVNEEGTPIVNDDEEQMTEADHAKILVEEARKRAELMELEIDDQLTEANYQDVCRSVIHDACLFGSGVIKAPVIINKTRRRWEQVAGDVHTLVTKDDLAPGVERVKIWDFFPDMSATELDECVFTFERKFVSRKQLLELMGRPGYIGSQIAAVLKESPSGLTASGSSYIAKLRELSGLSVDINKGKYELWEYHGPLNNDDLKSCGCSDIDENDLSEKSVVAVFIGSHVIKVDLNPLETNDNPYSMFIYEPDDSSIFGMGVPYITRHEQRVLNTTWRMIIDNAGLSTAPQTLLNTHLVTPADGDWNLKPRKIWTANNPDTDLRKAFATFDIPSHQAELTAIYELAKRMIDDVTNLPLLAQGEVGSAPDTASGMSMLLNSSNVVLRRVVKAFDDDVTTKVITRFYDWNMQNSEKEEIKGDYDVKARGSSALLVKETQTQALLGLLQLSSNPQFGSLTKTAALYRKAVQAQHLVADEIVKTDDEIELENNQDAPVAPEIMLAQLEADLKLKIAEMSSQTDITVARIRSQDNIISNESSVAETQIKEDNRANLYLAESTLKREMGEGI